MRAVREDKMPLDDAGLYKEIDPAVKAALLKYGTAFESVLDAAREWEAKNP
jgi:DNA-binding HxlR family transcriptional regulator